MKYRNIRRKYTGKLPQRKKGKVENTNGPHSHVLIFYLDN
jgi:hypothetical protein